LTLHAKAHDKKKAFFLCDHFPVKKYVTISELLDQTDLQREGKAEGLTLRAAMRAVSTSLAAAISSSSNLDGSPYSINATLPCPKTPLLHPLSALFFKCCTQQAKLEWTEQACQGPLLSSSYPSGPRSNE